MLNNITIEGRIVDAPTLRYNRDNVPFVTFCIANDRDYNRDITDFLDCIAFGKTAGFINDYFGKGSKILLRGSVQTSKWTDNNGANRKDWKIAVDHAYFMESATRQQNRNNVGQNPEPQPTKTQFAPDVSGEDFEEIGGNVPF